MHSKPAFYAPSLLNIAIMSKLKEVGIVTESANVSQDDIPVLHREDNILLGKLGYKSEFKREFSVRIGTIYILDYACLTLWPSS